MRKARQLTSLRVDQYRRKSKIILHRVPVSQVMKPFRSRGKHGVLNGPKFRDRRDPSGQRGVVEPSSILRSISDR